jgi:hypothetical protein
LCHAGLSNSFFVMRPNPIMEAITSQAITTS